MGVGLGSVVAICASTVSPNPNLSPLLTLTLAIMRQHGADSSSSGGRVSVVAIMRQHGEG